MVLNGKASTSGVSNTHSALTDNIVALPVQNRIATLPQVLRPKLESPSLTDRCYPKKTTLGERDDANSHNPSSESLIQEGNARLSGEPLTPLEYIKWLPSRFREATIRAYMPSNRSLNKEPNFPKIDKRQGGVAVSSHSQAQLPMLLTLVEKGHRRVNAAFCGIKHSVSANTKDLRRT